MARSYASGATGISCRFWRSWASPNNPDSSWLLRASKSSIRPRFSEPPDALEDYVEHDAARYHDEQHDRVPKPQVELRHVAEVHPVDARDYGRHGDNTGPRADPAGLLILLDAH